MIIALLVTWLPKLSCSFSVLIACAVNQRIGPANFGQPVMDYCIVSQRAMVTTPGPVPHMNTADWSPRLSDRIPLDLRAVPSRPGLHLISGVWS